MAPVVRVGFVLGLVLLFSLYGCQTIGTPSAKNDAAIKQIKIGRSQQSDVQRLLGTPTEIYSKVVIGGTTFDVWGYSYRHHEIDWLELVPVANFYATAGKTEEASVVVYFDSSGLVADVQINRRKDQNVSLR